MDGTGGEDVELEEKDREIQEVLFGNILKRDALIRLVTQYLFFNYFHIPISNSYT